MRIATCPQTPIAGADVRCPWPFFEAKARHEHEQDTSPFVWSDIIYVPSLNYTLLFAALLFFVVSKFLRHPPFVREGGLDSS
jgi:hypothetical protein